MATKTEILEQELNKGNKKKDRAIGLFGKMGLFREPGEIIIDRAIEPVDLLSAYHLVYNIFLESGYIKPNDTRIRIRPYEVLIEMATFIAKISNKVVGVHSVVPDTPEFGLPSDSAFKGELDKIRNMGERRICEATNLAIHPRFRKGPVSTELMRIMYAHAVETGCTDLIATVSPSHQFFYEFMGLELVGEVRNYSGEVKDPVIMMRYDIPKHLELIERIKKDPSKISKSEVFVGHFLIIDNPYLKKIDLWEEKSEVQLSEFWEALDKGLKKARMSLDMLFMELALEKVRV